MRARLVPICLVVVVLLAGGAGCARVEPPFTVSTVIGQLDRPWDIAFTPGGSMLFTERVGRVNILFGGQRRILADPADVVAIGEGGMMGLAVDPGFSGNRRIYTCFLSNVSGVRDIRVVRWEVNDAVTALTDRADILTGISANGAGFHSGCRLRFGPDGALWVTTGDATIGTAPQSPTSLNGKVLRITTDGDGAPGNAGGRFRPEVFTYGHRNVQGIGFAAGRAYGIEHGSTREDEVNLLERGQNYGRDPVGPGGTYDDTQPMTDLVKFPTARRAVWSSGPTSTIAPSGGTFLSGPQWKGWDGTLAVAVLKNRHLRVIAFDQNGTAVTKEWSRISDRGRLRVAVQGPDGNLYVATDANPGQIFKVTPG